MNLVYYQLHASLRSANLSLPDEEKVLGGYLTIKDIATGQSNMFSIGNISAQENDNCMAVSYKQACLLYDDRGLVLAYESLNNKKEGYGAIRGYESIYSFFGGPNHDDLNEGIAVMSFFLIENIGKETTPTVVTRYFDKVVKEVAKRNRYYKLLKKSIEDLTVRTLK